MMLYAITGQGQTALVDGPAESECHELWAEFMGNVTESLGEKPDCVGDCPVWADRRLRYLQDLMHFFTGTRPRKVCEIEVFLAMLVKSHGFRAVAMQMAHVAG